MPSTRPQSGENYPTAYEVTLGCDSFQPRELYLRQQLTSATQSLVASRLARGHLVFVCKSPNERPNVIDMSRPPPVDLHWYNRAIEPVVGPLKPADLAPVIAGLTQMLRAGYFDELDMLLKSFKVKNAAPEMMVTMLRATFPARRNPLHQWAGFLKKVRIELSERNLDTSKILSGLA